MTKCIGCSKNFAPRGFKTHIKSCKAYKYKKFADVLPNLPDASVPLEGFGVDPVEPGPSNLNNDPPVNEIEVNKT